MTSTSTFTGGSSSKPSSRVLRPPGGGSSISFGGDDVTTPPKRTESDTKPAEARKESLSGIISHGNHPSQAVATGGQQNYAEANAMKTESTTAAPAAPVNSKARTSGFNPITGEPYGTSSSSASSQGNTSISVKQPPGGASTKLW